MFSYMLDKIAMLDRSPLNSLKSNVDLAYMLDETCFISQRCDPRVVLCFPKRHMDTHAFL